MLITNKNTSKLGIQKRTLNRTVRFGPISLRFISLLLVGTIGLFYIAASAEGASKSYQVYTHTTEFEKLTKENDWLRSEKDRLSTLKEAERVVAEFQLEPIKNSDVSYDTTSQVNH